MATNNSINKGSIVLQVIRQQ